MVHHILAAVDASEGARRAARFARELAGQLSARLTLLHVLEPIAAVTVGFPEAYGLAHRSESPEEIAQVKALLAEMAQGFPAERLETAIEYGSPAQVICEQALARDADLVALGARGTGALGRLLLGSISDRVVHECRRSVLVVHMDQPT
jgi:nucleotide-binding universal stress UspA family protein